SALVLEANWPNVAQLRWEHYHDQLVAARAKLTPAQTDSAYHAGDVRLFQHILVSVPPSAASKVEQDKKQQAEGLLRQVQAQRGAAALVRQAIQEVAPATEDRRKLATYRGGVFRVRDLARWLFALDQRDVSSIGMASDAQLTEFVRRLAQRELLLREVDSAGV